MGNIVYSEALKSDIPGMAQIRAMEWETEAYWNRRISGYYNCELHPQKALEPRILYVAKEGETVVGFIAGHLTTRYECEGELEWINVAGEYRGTGMASELLRLIARWFMTQRAHRICVDVDPQNLTARAFYRRHYAKELNPHWMVWADIRVLFHENSGS